MVQIIVPDDKVCGAEYLVKRASGGEMEFISTTKALDRDGDVMIPMGVKDHLDRYLKNPVFLWQHNADLPPIGKVTDYEMGEDQNTFAVEWSRQETNELAHTIRGLFEDGHLNATSIRFYPHAEGSKLYENQHGRTITEWELLEESAVTIPSNHEALRRAASKYKSVGRFASLLSPLCELEATRSGIVAVKPKAAPKRKRYEFETLQEVMDFSEKIGDFQKRLDFTKTAVGTFDAVTEPKGEGSAAHDHALIVNLDAGKVLLGKTAQAADGHFHEVTEVGTTEPAGDDNHSHDWALKGIDEKSPEPKEEKEETPEEERSLSAEIASLKNSKPGSLVLATLSKLIEDHKKEIAG